MILWCLFRSYIRAPVKILYMWVVAIVMVIAFQGLWKSAYSRSNMKPKSIPKQARKWIEELFCWFQVLRQDFMFLSFCIHFAFICMHVPSFYFDLHAYSFCFAFISCHFPFVLLSCSFVIICSHVHSFSFHIHSNVHSCPFIFLSFACIFLSFCIHVLSFPFQSYGNYGSMTLWLGRGTECNKCLSPSYR